MKSRSGLRLIVLLVIAWPCVTMAQQRSPSEFSRDRQVALTALKEGRHAPAAQLLHELVQQNPADGELWLDLARAHEGASQHQEAIRALQRADELGFGIPAILSYRIAGLFAKLGRRDSVMTWLDTSLGARLEQRPRLQTDETFAAFRNDPEYRRLAGLAPELPLSRDAGWIYDLDFLVGEIERLHASPDRPAFGETFRASVRTLRAAIPNLPDSQVFVEMQRLVAALGDGHSVLYPIPSERVPLGNLPIDLYDFGDRLFVVRAEDEARDLVGAEILAFGTMPTGRVLAAIRPYVTRDNPMSLRMVRPFYLTMPAFLRAIGATAVDDTVGLRIRDRAGTVREVRLSAAGFRPPAPLTAQSPTPPLYLQRPEANYWYTVLANLDALYFQYNQVQNAPDVPIAAFADTLLAAVRRTHVKNLIVDVRRNSGGNGSLNRPLVNTLVHFATDAADHHIYILAGRNTFSAAQNFVNSVEALTDAVFVGEPTGSRPNMVGENSTVLLPFSGIRASISSRYFQDSHAQDARIWIAPDVPATLTVEDYFADRDPVLKALGDLIRSRREHR